MSQFRFGNCKIEHQNIFYHKSNGLTSLSLPIQTGVCITITLTNGIWEGHIVDKVI